VRKLHASENILALFKVNKSAQLQICSSPKVLLERE
jgi:hypothetical protein